MSGEKNDFNSIQYYNILFYIMFFFILNILFEFLRISWTRTPSSKFWSHVAKKRFWRSFHPPSVPPFFAPTFGRQYEVSSKALEPGSTKLEWCIITTTPPRLHWRNIRWVHSDAFSYITYWGIHKQKGEN